MSLFLLAAALSAIAAIYCEERSQGRHPAFYLLKPLTTVLIIAAAMLAPEAEADYQRWICVALALSLCGDIALMFSGDRAFLLGLGSFLLAHILFVVAFAGSGLVAPPLWSWMAVSAGGLFLIWLLPRTGKLKIPVLIYVLALAGMSLVAAGRFDIRGGDRSAILAVAGALIFLLSDAALSVRQFHRSYPRAQFLILSSYFLAIGLLAASVAGSAGTQG